MLDSGIHPASKLVIDLVVEALSAVIVGTLQPYIDKFGARRLREFGSTYRRWRKCPLPDHASEWSKQSPIYGRSYQ
jgi:hypothetical protein